MWNFRSIVWNGSRKALRKRLDSRQTHQLSRQLQVEVLEDRTVPTVSWTSGTALPAARSGDAAVLAPDQSILAIGGTTTVNQLALTGTSWGAASPIDQARVSPGIASLGNGSLLVYGGSVSGTAQNSTIIYTAASGSTAAAAMSTPRALMAFTGDGSGHAFAIGGLDASGHALATVEEYSASSGTWTPLASLPQARSGAAAVYDGSGHIFVVGGMLNGSTRTATVLEYTVASNKWTTLASMPTAVSETAAVFGPDGQLYVIGGRGSGGPTSTVQVYSPATNKWSKGTSLPVGVSDEAAVVDAQMRIEVIGGTAAGDNPHPSSSVYVSQSLVNYSPEFTTGSSSLPAATAGAPYTAAIRAIGSPAPTFSLVSGPTGLSISASGAITWAPSASQIGTATLVVSAQNSAGGIQQTFTITVTKDVTPPSVPFLSLGTIVSTSAIPVDWTPSTDNVGVAGYQLYQYHPAVYKGHSGRGGGITLVSPAYYSLLVNDIPSTATSYTLTGLNPLTTYQLALEAYDAAGNRSGYSNIVTGTTLQTPSLTYYQGSYVDPTLSVIANHTLTFTVYASGSPAPAISLVSAPAGVSYSSNTITWVPTASEVGTGTIVLQAVNSVGTAKLDIPVTVTADLPAPTLSVNGGLTYSLGNYTTAAGNPNSYQVALNPGFDISGGTHPQYAMVGTPFAFQLTGVSNTNPIVYSIVSGPAGLTLDPNTGAGAWTPTAGDASAATSVTVSLTNSAGATDLTFTFPTYFTTAPTKVSITFDTSVSGSSPSTWVPVVSWTPPAGSAAVADYAIVVNDLNKYPNGITTYDTHGTATTFALPTGIVDQNSINVVAYDAGGNPSQISTSNAELYLAALGGLSWSFSSPTAIVGQPINIQFSGGYNTYAIASGPAGASIDSASGLLTWTPSLSDLGTTTLVVAASNTNGWGTIDATVSIPVSFASAPTGLSVTSTTDPVTQITTWTAAWSPPTLGTAAITGYQLVVTDSTGATTVYNVPAATLSQVISTQTVYHGTIQVAAVDANGDLGIWSSPLSF
jgi:hypothetical protein